MISLSTARLAAVALACASLLSAGCSQEPVNAYVGSESCRECHERFYKLWAPSHHGKAMQPYTDAFAAEFLTPQTNSIAISNYTYQAVIGPSEGHITATGPEGSRDLPIEQVMGGKNVFFFLTPMERGRLQVMPLSYNVKTRSWYDTTASMVRHFNLEEDEAVHWTDPLLTFNTACYNCHVSQLQKNYDLATDTYKTVWREPGINCEACHGPCGNHVRVCQKAGNKKLPDDALEIVSWKTLSPQQKNDACSVCHAKMSPLTLTFDTGEKLFDHYDLVCLEDHDFYPDGRDLGENYTLTSWMMSPCAQSGKLDCIHCHTSSGRYRFKKDNPNGACLPCHAERVANVKEHSHHKKDGPTRHCVSCHMPMTEFGRMNRSDHSMRPPSPRATLAFKSPNACNICHEDKDAAWAAKHIETWHPDGQSTDRILRAGRLVQWARQEQWRHLPEILAYIQEKDADPVVITSLVRLLYGCPDRAKLPALRDLLKHSSPLVRSAAVTSMGLVDTYAVREVTPLLDDPFRLVRIRAADVLLDFPREQLPEATRQRFEAAEKEWLNSLSVLEDQWSSHYNQGNYWGRRDRQELSLKAYQTAIQKRPDIIPPYVNASITASKLNQPTLAKTYLEKAHSIEPDSGAVNLNLGLLLSELKDPDGAQKHLHLALKDRHTRSQAAYNLAVLVGETDPSEAATLCRQALESDPDNAKLRQTLMYYASRAQTPKP